MEATTAPPPVTTPTRRALPGAAVAVVVGVLIAVIWSYEFVDDVVGGAISGLFLGADHVAEPGLVGTLAFATVAGLAGTFTACNIACFASVGPLAAGTGATTPSRAALVRHAAAQLGWLALGMSVVAAAYGVVVVAAGDGTVMLSDETMAGMPVRLVQASVINVVLGVGLVYVAVRYLTGAPLRGRRGILSLGALLGLLVVGRPFPMFREVLAAAVDAHPLVGVGLLVLVVLGNLALVGILYLAFVAAAGPALQRFVARHQLTVLRVGGYLLLALGAFSIAYWGLRVPAIFGIGWFPTV
ncbi:MULTISPECIES: hypothetical protein [unclassified Isoptericola]|uniref:hypothetical protein n=1 Tax=unclassified Isoptericola TaxID=2623355 RepID=UPI0027126073|nr:MULTISPECIES: hypothetical protein [unclassified Isoptericola]MDO8143833.1 hypothetical protein [Isoptericola sp. 178]MDO8147728.1 hypothetical protein [Isoptericola sp. b515]